MEPKWILLGIGLVVALNIAISVVVHTVYASSLKDVVQPEPVIGLLEIPIPFADGDTIKGFINPENIQKHLHVLTKKGHVSGTPNNLEVAKYIRDELISQGLEKVHFNEYDVLLSYPNWSTPNTVEIMDVNGETIYKTKGRSPAIVKEEQMDPDVELHWFAYSANGVVEGDIVYVNSASERDFAHLKSLEIELEGKIFLARQSGVFRGNIAQRAMEYGAKGVLIYSDPVQTASWGTAPNETYSRTDKMPPNAVQRGTVILGFGDPRSPAFPSIEGLYKEKDEEQLYAEKKLPNIPLLPIPYSDAQYLFANMNGDAVIPAFQGKLNVTYRYGPGLINNQKLRMTVHAKNEEWRIQNVLGFIKGHQESEKLVILSNHYDAWTYGAIDPNSGTATLLEVSRALKAYQNSTGWKPARSILFAHWDTEEYSLIGSTEFTEEYRVQLMNRAVAIVNMDFIGGNQTLWATASPTIANVFLNVAANVSHPNKDERDLGRKTIYESWAHFTPSKKNSSQPHCAMPSGGSDHTAFFDYLGVPIIFFSANSLDAAPTYPLYHTIYETPYLTEHFLDPEFKMHASIAEMFIKLALKFTEADILPYDLRRFMDDVENDYLPQLSESFAEAQRRNNENSDYLTLGLEQLQFMRKVVEELSHQVNQRNITRLELLPLINRIDENRRLIEFEKCFINPRGASDNPQARHVLYHPSSKDTYKGGVMHVIHDIITKISSTSDEKKLNKYSKRLAVEISHVNFAFICAKHSLNSLLGPF